MRSAIVGGSQSKLHGVKCRLCPHLTRQGEAVLYDTLPSYGFVDNRYVVHVECMRGAVERAPEGTPVRAVAARAAAIRRRAVAIARRTNAVVDPQPVGISVDSRPVGVAP